MKKLITLIAALAAVATCSITAMAANETVTGAGFYDIGTVEGVTITPVASSSSVTVTEAQADVDGDEANETFYVNSDKLTVEYAAKVGARYGWILVEGTGLPTADDQIHYIDQTTIETSPTTFVVYPLLPTKTTELTLYIASDDDDFISIPLNYAVSGTYEVIGSDDGEEGGEEGGDTPTYTLGDVNDDNAINSSDSLMTLKIAAKLITPTDAETLAANVNGDETINSSDALEILKFAAKLIDSFSGGNK